MKKTGHRRADYQNRVHNRYANHENGYGIYQRMNKHPLNARFLFPGDLIRLKIEVTEYMTQ
jgi:hypothetical protein